MLSVDEPRWRKTLLIVAGKLTLRSSFLLGEEFSRERRRSVKDPRPIFDRDFEFTPFVPLVP